MTTVLECCSAGFKYIGNTALTLEKEGYEVPFGYEEAIGFMFGTQLRDKDGVAASVGLSLTLPWPPVVYIFSLLGCLRRVGCLLAKARKNGQQPSEGTIREVRSHRKLEGARTDVFDSDTAFSRYDSGHPSSFRISFHCRRVTLISSALNRAPSTQSLLESATSTVKARPRRAIRSQSLDSRSPAYETSQSGTTVRIRPVTSLLSRFRPVI